METPFADRLCQILSEAFTTEPDAVQALLCAIAPCGDELNDHPTIQIAGPMAGNKRNRLSMLGLLNGVCEEGYAVASVHPDEPDAYGRYAILRFEVVKQNFGDDSE